MPGPLAQKIRAKFPGVYDDLDDAALEKAVLAKYPEYADMAEPERPAAQEPSMLDRVLADSPSAPLQVRAGQALGRFVKANPVAAAATGGAMLAAPFTGGGSILGGMAAAGLGAAGGAGAAIAGRQLVTGKPESAGGTLRTMATEGAANAAGEGIGRGVVKLGNLVIPKMLKGILRPGKGVQQEFGDVVDVMRRERIPVGQSVTAGTRASASAKEADALIAQAQAGGAAPVTPREIVREFRPVRDEVSRRAANASPDAPGQMQELVQRAKDLKAKGAVDVVENQALKRQAQRDASAAFRAQDKGAVIKDTTAKLDKAVAVGRQKAAEARVPGVKAVNTRTQELMGLERALEDAEARSGGVVGLNPANWLSGLAPGLGSRLAFGADAAATAQQAPLARLIRQALLSQLGAVSDQEP
jgi:hypothetical protein